MKHLVLTAALIVGLASLASVAIAQEPVWDANTVILESQKLTDGIFAVIPQGANEMADKGLPIATTSGFVVGEESVLVIDTMLNKRLNAQLFGLIRAETDLPIRYAVNTSFHGDHSYGNQYLPDETIIIQHGAASEFIGEHLEADKMFMIKNFGEGRGIEDIAATPANILVGTNGQLEVNLGGVIVNIRDYGFAQTGGDLFVSVPKANVLWTGNPVIAKAPALPWLLDGQLIETRDTLEAVLATVDAQTQIVPGHGPVTGMETIQWNIDYLNAVEREVKAALAEGLSLEQTIERVQLSDFQGYALFGWVHPGLNVPAAYQDLR
ncbi:MAG: MBL fold metallo-hydrolase [Sneathiella sp.]|nr:MBL fold metallo-hydrolase [Sneathiella sp.]